MNPQFLFTCKLYKVFTHPPLATVESTSASTLRFTAEDEKLTREGLDSLANEGKLGAVLAQFSISFRNTDENRSYVQKLIAMFGRDYPLAIEIRHFSWNEPAVLREFSSLGVGFVNIDQPLLGNALHATRHVTGPLGCVRLHGRNCQQWFASSKVEDRYNFLYTPEQLESWKERIEEIGEQAERTFVVTNNHYLGKAAANATELKIMLTGKKVKAPREWAGLIRSRLCSRIGRGMGGGGSLGDSSLLLTCRAELRGGSRDGRQSLWRATAQARSPATSAERSMALKPFRLVGSINSNCERRSRRLPTILPPFAMKLSIWKTC